MLTIDLADKVALVVGGSRGIGGAITECLCAAGASTVFTHTGAPKRRNAVADLRARLEQAGGEAEAVALAATDPRATTALVDRIVQQRGRIDILVANVGRNVARPAEQVDDAEWQQLMDLNLGSAFYAVRAVLPHMVAQRHGRILLIGSSAVCDGGGGAIDYAAAKAGLVGMMKYLCKTYARSGILTNVVHPCVIETELLMERYADPAKREALIAQVPVGRLGRPADIAGLVAYLASCWGSFICGQEILVDGGRTVFGR